MLSNEEKNIFDQFVSWVYLKFPSAMIWAFGSRARGDATGESDLDVCVVLDKFNDENEMVIMDIARQIGSEHGLIITIVIYSRKEFEKVPLADSGLIYYILSYGVPGSK